jgi:uncharacterized phiE125 gp8 family phage protein
MNQIRVVTPPAEQPVTVEEVKIDVRVDHDDDAGLLESLIKAATTEAENTARCAFVTRTLELALDRWPADGQIPLPMPPLAAVTAVEYIDTGNVRQQVAPADYIVLSDLRPAVLMPAYGKTWPANLRAVSPIRITYTAGYGDAAAVPEIYRRLVRALVVIDYEHREAMTADGKRQRDLVLARLQADWGW